MDMRTYLEAERAVWEHWDLEVTERWVQYGTSGPRLRVLETGDPGGPPVLFVHGAGTSGTCWIDLASRLQDHRCLLLDRPGCGCSQPLSEAPGLGGFPLYADGLLEAVLDGLGVARAHVVSNSLGGYFALRGAARHPDRFGRLLHVGWTVGASVHELPTVMRIGGSSVVGRIAARLPMPEAAVRTLHRRTGLRAAIDDGRVPDVAMHWSWALMNHTRTRRHEFTMLGGTSLARQLDALVLEPALLDRVLAPVRVLYGADDFFGTVETMEALTDALPDATLEVWEGAGHAVWLDDLPRAEKAVRDHLMAA